MGGDIVLHGKANTKTETIFEFNDSWDGVAFVLYPRRSSYIQLQRSQAYQDGIADRVAGTYERLLYVILSVRAEMPVVSENYWDHFVSFRYPSMEALKKMYQSDKFHEANANRIKALESTIAVLFKPTPLPE
jgi:uncharacterized protein (DUF1330 family)